MKTNTTLDTIRKRINILNAVIDYSMKNNKSIFTNIVNVIDDTDSHIDVKSIIDYFEINPFDFYKYVHTHYFNPLDSDIDCWTDPNAAYLRTEYLKDKIETYNTVFIQILDLLQKKERINMAHIIADIANKHMNS